MDKKTVLLEERNLLFERQASFLKESLNISEDRYQSLHVIIEELRNEFFKKAEDSIIKDTNLKSKDEQIFEYRQNINFLKTSYTDKQGRYLELQTEFQKFRESCNMKDQEISNLKSQLKLLEEQNCDKQRYIAFLKDSLGTKETQNSALRTKIDETLNEVNMRDKKLLEMVVKLKFLNEQQIDHQRQIGFLEDALGSKDRQFSLLQNDIEQLRSSLEDKMKLLSDEPLKSTRNFKVGDYISTETRPASSDMTFNYSSLQVEMSPSAHEDSSNFDTDKLVMFTPGSKRSDSSLGSTFEIAASDRKSPIRQTIIEEIDDGDENLSCPNIPEPHTIYNPDEKNFKTKLWKIFNDYIEYKNTESKENLEEFSRNQFKFTLEGSEQIYELPNYKEKFPSCQMFNVDTVLYPRDVTISAREDRIIDLGQMCVINEKITDDSTFSVDFPPNFGSSKSPASETPANFKAQSCNF